MHTPLIKWSAILWTAAFAYANGRIEDQRAGAAEECRALPMDPNYEVSMSLVQMKSKQDKRPPDDLYAEQFDSGDVVFTTLQPAESLLVQATARVESLEVVADIAPARAAKEEQNEDAEPQAGGSKPSIAQAAEEEQKEEAEPQTAGSKPSIAKASRVPILPEAPVQLLSKIQNASSLPPVLNESSSAGPAVSMEHSKSNTTLAMELLEKAKNLKIWTSLLQGARQSSVFRQATTNNAAVVLIIMVSAVIGFGAILFVVLYQVVHAHSDHEHYAAGHLQAPISGSNARPDSSRHLRSPKVTSPPKMMNVNAMAQASPTPKIVNPQLLQPPSPDRATKPSQVPQALPPALGEAAMLCPELFVPEDSECVLAVPSLQGSVEKKEAKAIKDKVGEPLLRITVDEPRQTPTPGNAKTFTGMTTERMTMTAWKDGYTLTYCELQYATSPASRRGRATCSIYKPTGELFARLEEAELGANPGMGDDPHLSGRASYNEAKGLPNGWRAYVLSSAAALQKGLLTMDVGNNSMWQLSISGQVAQRSMVVKQHTDSGVAPIMAAVETGMDFRFKSGGVQYYKLRVAPQVDAGLVIITILAIDRMAQIGG